MSLADDQWNLRNFIRIAQDTTTETTEMLPQALEQLDQIDLLYRNFIDSAGTVKPVLTAVLLMNGHASFRAAVRLAVSGQLPPVFMALRGAIESALYANAIFVDKELQDIWLQRHRDEEARNRCKNAFGLKKLLKFLTEASDMQFSNLIKDQYEATIDFGAHPNNRSLLSHLRFSELEGGAQAVELAYLHGYRSTELRQCFVACAEVGLAVLLIALICAPQHPKLKEMNAKALALQDALPQFITLLGLQMRPTN